MAFRTVEKFLEFHPGVEDRIQQRLFSASGELSKALRRAHDKVIFTSTLLMSVIAAEIAGRLSIVAAGWFLAGIAGIAFVAEFGARLWGWQSHGIPGGLLAPMVSRHARQRYFVQNTSLMAFSRSHGFDYRPSHEAVRLTIERGKVAEIATVTTDALGNLEPSDTKFSPGALRILVVGDSFTSLPGNNDVYAGVKQPDWPHLCKLALEGTLGPGRVNVMNFGRPSAGVLQMVDIAADKATTLKPDIVVLAFITRDLDRPRRYFSTRRVGGKERELLHTECSPHPDLLHTQDTTVIDERVTEAWARRLVESGKEDDLLIAIEQRRFDLLRKMSGRTCRVAGFDRSFFLDRVLAGTFFTRFVGAAFGTMPMLTIKDYRDDPVFMQSLTALRASGAEILCVHLPVRQELISKDLHFSWAGPRYLFHSLAESLGEPIHLIGGSIDIPPEEIDARYQRTETDAHPSLWMKQIFAKLIADLVLTLPAAQKAARPLQHPHAN